MAKKLNDESLKKWAVKYVEGMLANLEFRDIYENDDVYHTFCVDEEDGMTFDELEKIYLAVLKVKIGD